MGIGTVLIFLAAGILVVLAAVFIFFRFEPDGPWIVARIKERLDAPRRKQRELEASLRVTNETLAELTRTVKRLVDTCGRLSDELAGTASAAQAQALEQALKELGERVAPLDQRLARLERDLGDAGAAAALHEPAPLPPVPTHTGYRSTPSIAPVPLMNAGGSAPEEGE